MLTDNVTIIRYPMGRRCKEFKRLDENTRDNTVINIVVVQLLNAGYIDELAEWKMDQGFSKINLHV